MSESQFDDLKSEMNESFIHMLECGVEPRRAFIMMLAIMMEFGAFNSQEWLSILSEAIVASPRLGGVGEHIVTTNQKGRA